MAAWYAQVILIIHAERMTGTKYLAKYPKTSSFLLKMGTCDKDISCVSVMLSENNAHTKNISQNNTNGKKKLTPPEKMSVIY